MTRSLKWTHVVVGLFVVLACAVGARVASAIQRDQSDGWQIPMNAQAEASPVAATPAAVARGRDIYRDKCARCHGPSGRGDGVDADPDHRPSDLTDGARAARNPDGVMFYKVWNGRRKPKMPSFSAQLSREDVWTVIQYVKTLRK